MHQNLDDLGSGGYDSRTFVPVCARKGESRAKLRAQAGRCFIPTLIGSIPSPPPPASWALPARRPRRGSCARLHGRRRCRANQRSADDGARRGRGVGKHRSLSLAGTCAPCWQDLQIGLKCGKSYVHEKHVARPILSPIIGLPHAREGDRAAIDRDRRDAERGTKPAGGNAHSLLHTTLTQLTGWVDGLAVSVRPAQPHVRRPFTRGYVLFTLPVHRAPWLD